MLDFIVMQISRVSLSWWTKPFFPKWSSLACHELRSLFFVLSDVTHCFLSGPWERRSAAVYICTGRHDSSVKFWSTVETGHENLGRAKPHDWSKFKQWKIITTYQRKVDVIKKKSISWISENFFLYPGSRIPLVADATRRPPAFSGDCPHWPSLKQDTQRKDEHTTGVRASSFPGSLILPPHRASEERGGKMRDPGNEVGVRAAE